MSLIACVFIVLVALEHLFICWMEMFAWETVGKKVFKGAMPDTMFSATKTLAANQGLYNGFIAAGLIWSLLISDPIWQVYVAIFFLSCVFIAGIYGGLSASKKIILTQALPALIALTAVAFSA